MQGKLGWGRGRRSFGLHGICVHILSIVKSHGSFLQKNKERDEVWPAAYIRSVWMDGRGQAREHRSLGSLL